MLFRVLMVTPETSVNVVLLELTEIKYVVSPKQNPSSHPNCG